MCGPLLEAAGVETESEGSCGGGSNPRAAAESRGHGPGTAGLRASLPNSDPACPSWPQPRNPQFWRIRHQQAECDDPAASGRPADPDSQPEEAKSAPEGSGKGSASSVGSWNMGKVLEAAARSKMARVPNVGRWEVPRKLRASAVTFGVRDQGGAEREWNGQTSLLGEIM